MTIKEKISILAKPIWCAKDIRLYFGVGHDKTKEMLETAIIKANALVPLSNNKVFSERVIELFTGHSREIEMNVLKAGVLDEEE